MEVETSCADDIDITKKRELCDLFPDAMAENCALVEFMSEIFLRFRNNDMETARERLGNYILWRQRVFGDLSDQTLESSPKVREQTQSCFLRVLPEHAPNGAAIIYLELRRHDASKYSAEDTLKTWHYLIILALKRRPCVAKDGFILTGNMEGVGLGNIDIGIPEAIVSAISNCMPVRLCNMFVINPPFVARVIVPVIKMLVSKKLGNRLNIITDVSTLQTVFNMPRELLPHTLGGLIEEDTMNLHIENVLAESVAA